MIYNSNLCIRCYENLPESPKMSEHYLFPVPKHSSIAAGGDTMMCSVCSYRIAPSKLRTVLEAIADKRILHMEVRAGSLLYSSFVNSERRTTTDDVEILDPCL